MKFNATVVRAVSNVKAWACSCVTASHVVAPTLGTLVHIHLPTSAPHLISPRPHTPSLTLGTSCVACMNIGGSTTDATHGVPVRSRAVGLCNDVSAVVVGGVGVALKPVARSKSATSTSSCQLPCMDPFGGVVDAVAKVVTRVGSAAPTTSPSDPFLLALLLGCRWRFSSGGVVGSRIRERRPTSVLPGLLMRLSSIAPGLSLLLVPPLLLILIFLVPAPAEASDVVGTHRGRAGSLVPVVRAAGGGRRGPIPSCGLSPSVLEGRRAMEHRGVVDGARTTQAAREDAVQVV